MKKRYHVGNYHRLLIVLMGILVISSIYFIFNYDGFSITGNVAASNIVLDGDPTGGVESL